MHVEEDVRCVEIFVKPLNDESPNDRDPRCAFSLTRPSARSRLGDIAYSSLPGFFDRRFALFPHVQRGRPTELWLGQCGRGQRVCFSERYQ